LSRDAVAASMRTGTVETKEKKGEKSFEVLRKDTSEKENTSIRRRKARDALDGSVK